MREIRHEVILPSKSDFQTSDAPWCSDSWLLPQRERETGSNESYRAEVWEKSAPFWWQHWQSFRNNIKPHSTKLALFPEHPPPHHHLSFSEERITNMERSPSLLSVGRAHERARGRSWQRLWCSLNWKAAVLTLSCPLPCRFPLWFQGLIPSTLSCKHGNQTRRKIVLWCVCSLRLSENCFSFQAEFTFVFGKQMHRIVCCQQLGLRSSGLSLVAE